MGNHDAIQGAIRIAVGQTAAAIGVSVTYRWCDESTTTKTYTAITGINAIRRGRTIRREAGDRGLLYEYDETFVLAQDAILVSGTIKQPTTRDQIVDGSITYQVVDIARDAFEGSWTLRCSRMLVSRSIAGTALE